MKKREFTITIGRNENGYYYNDKDCNISSVSMIEVCGLLFARFGATIQHDAEKNNIVEYQIDISKIKFK